MMNRNEFVLIDEQNQPVLEGTYQEMLDTKIYLNALGVDNIKLEKIGQSKGNDNV